MVAISEIFSAVRLIFYLPEIEESEETELTEAEQFFFGMKGYWEMPKFTQLTFTTPDGRHVHMIKGGPVMNNPDNPDRTETAFMDENHGEFEKKTLKSPEKKLF